MVELDYTGHPLFDVGLAAIVAFVEKTHPTELTEDDLEKVADFIRDNYTRQPLTSFLTTSLPNSDFTQPAFKDNQARRREYAGRVARSYGDDVVKSDEVCVFTGKPAMGLALSLKRDEKTGKEVLPPGRAYRQHIPLITGEDIINFSPWGDPGLPVSGEALLCLQFFPMGCRKCAGRLLAVHSDNYAILQAAAEQAWKENLAAITLAQTTNETKLPDASSSAPSLLIETIITLTRKQNDIQQAHIERRKRDQQYSVTAYHLTNSGQSSPLDENSPLLKIYHLPMSSVRFLQRATNIPENRTTWDMLVTRGKQRVKVKPAKDTQEKQLKSAGNDMPVVHKSARNFFYEAIFRLPQEAERFIREYFLNAPDLHPIAKDGHPLSNTTPRYTTFIIPWSFVELFLQEVMHMEKKRIAAIKELGDRLAAYVKDSDDKRFFNTFYYVKRSDFFLDEITRVDKSATAYRKMLLFPFDLFCTVFFEPDGNDELRFDWKIARDLTFIRMLEWLHEHDDKFSEHVSSLAEDNSDQTHSRDEKL